MYRDDPWVVISDSQDRPTRILLDLWRHTYVISHVLDYARHFLPFSLFRFYFLFPLCLSDSNFYFLSVLIIPLISIICSHFLCFLFTLFLYSLFTLFLYPLFTHSFFNLLSLLSLFSSICLSHTFLPTISLSVSPFRTKTIQFPYSNRRNNTTNITTYYIPNKAVSYGTPSHAMVRKSSLP